MSSCHKCTTLHPPTTVPQYHMYHTECTKRIVPKNACGPDVPYQSVPYVPNVPYQKKRRTQNMYPCTVPYVPNVPYQKKRGVPKTCTHVPYHMYQMYLTQKNGTKTHPLFFWYGTFGTYGTVHGYMFWVRLFFWYGTFGTYGTVHGYFLVHLFFGTVRLVHMCLARLCLVQYLICAAHYSTYGM